MDDDDCLSSSMTTGLEGAVFSVFNACLLLSSTLKFGSLLRQEVLSSSWVKGFSVRFHWLNSSKVGSRTTSKALQLKAERAISPSVIDWGKLFDT